MLALSELNPKHFPTTPEIDSNLKTLLDRMNQVRAVYNKPMIVTSGLRSIEDHIRIYHEKGVADDKIPMGSQHLKGAAVDILDKDGSLMEWCKSHESLLASIGLWCEERDEAPRVHFQIFPPHSGHRFFKP